MILVLNSCSSSKKLNSEKSFSEEFKFRYFQKSLLYSFNNSTEIKKILDEDKSGYSEPILNERAYIIIDSLAKETYLEIKTDSLNSINRRAEGSSGKVVFGKILKKYNSKWLDKIIKEEYKKVKK